MRDRERELEEEREERGGRRGGGGEGGRGGGEGRPGILASIKLPNERLRLPSSSWLTHHSGVRDTPIMSTAPIITKNFSVKSREAARIFPSPQEKYGQRSVLLKIAKSIT